MSSILNGFYFGDRTCLDLLLLVHTCLPAAKMNQGDHCSSCPPTGCFQESGGPRGISPFPGTTKDVRYNEVRKITDDINQQCLTNRPGPPCCDKGNAHRAPCHGETCVDGGGGDYREVVTAPDYTRQEHMQQEMPTVGSDFRKADESKFPPCYLPQPNDDFITKDQARMLEPSGEHVGHQFDSGLIGRVTAADWRMNNRHMLSKTCNVLLHVNKTEHNCKNTMARAYSIIDKTQATSTQSLRERSQLVTKWKCTLERAIEAMIEEITQLGQERIRLKQSLVVLGMPYSIATECLQRRSTRPESERIYDQPEEEMYRELQLIENIRNTFNKTLATVEAQQDENRKNRQRLEMDWSDKKVSNEIETMNVAYNNHSTITLFHPGATRFPSDQTSEEYWEHFSKEILDEAEKCRQKSTALRGTLNGIIMNAARDLRNQADAVELAFTARINCMEEIEKRLTAELKECLQKLADTENLILKMTRGIASLDAGMKVAQTRLDDRTHRPHVENCRDATQYKLVEEVGTIHNGMSAMKEQADEAERTKQMLMKTREELEKEIMLKRRSIIMDRERCMLIRSHFPSATQLSGYAKA